MKIPATCILLFICICRDQINGTGRNTHTKSRTVFRAPMMVIHKTLFRHTPGVVGSHSFLSGRHCTNVKMNWIPLTTPIKAPTVQQITANVRVEPKMRKYRARTANLNVEAEMKYKASSMIIDYEHESGEHPSLCFASAALLPALMNMLGSVALTLKKALMFLTSMICLPAPRWIPIGQLHQ